MVFANNRVLRLLDGGASGITTPAKGVNSSLQQPAPPHHCGKLLRSAGQDRAAKLERFGHVPERLNGLARAPDCDCAVAEQPTYNGLVHVHALNLVEVHLHRMSLD